MKLFNRTDLTPIQIQERARRKRERIKMRGMPNPKGRKPRQFTASGLPILKPMQAPGPVSVSDLARLTAILPWLMRRIGHGGSHPTRR